MTISKDGNTLKIPYFRNYALSSMPGTITRAIIVVHGSNRNADEYYNNMITASIDCPSALDYTLVLAPVFLTEDDINDHNLGTEYPYWSSGGWKDGSLSKDYSTNPRPIRISSFDVMDKIIQTILNNAPNLEDIIITGHSAGGQFTQRYLASSTKLAEIDNNYSSISYEGVVANPSSYVYMDNKRIVAGTTNNFAVPNTTCTNYNEYKYGLDDLYNYLSPSGTAQIRNWCQNRKTTYLIGQNDDDPNSSSLETGCRAMLQGTHRLERARVFYNHLLNYYGNSITNYHKIYEIAGVGHSNLGMFSSSIGKQIYYPCGATEVNPCQDFSLICEAQIDNGDWVEGSCSVVVEEGKRL